MSEALDHAVRSAVLRGFADTGRPPSPDEISTSMAVPQIEIERALHRLADAHLLVLAVEQQWRLARAWYANRLDPGFRRRTPEEAQAVFEGLGLTDTFWSLRG